MTAQAGSRRSDGSGALGLAARDRRCLELAQARLPPWYSLTSLLSHILFSPSLPRRSSVNGGGGGQIRHHEHELRRRSSPNPFARRSGGRTPNLTVGCWVSTTSNWIPRRVPFLFLFHFLRWARKRPLLRSRLTVIFAPRWLQKPPQLMFFAHLRKFPYI